MSGVVFPGLSPQSLYNLWDLMHREVESPPPAPADIDFPRGDIHVVLPCRVNHTGWSNRTLRGERMVTHPQYWLLETEYGTAYFGRETSSSLTYGWKGPSLYRHYVDKGGQLQAPFRGERAEVSLLLTSNKWIAVALRTSSVTQGRWPRVEGLWSLGQITGLLSTLPEPEKRPRWDGGIGLTLRSGWRFGLTGGQEEYLEAEGSDFYHTLCEDGVSVREVIPLTRVFELFAAAKGKGRYF